MRDIGDTVREARAAKHRLELDNQPFTELVVGFQDMAYGYAYALVRDPVTAQDVVQESFLRAWRKLDHLRDAEAFPGWFRQIVRTNALAVLRARQRAADADGWGRPVDPDRAPSPGPGPEEQAVDSESQREVQEAIMRLPERLRASVLMHYVDGLRLEDVAEFLQIDVTAARKRVQRGRDRMRKDLEARIRESVREFRPSNSGTLLENVNIYTNFAVAAQLGQISLLEAMLVDGIDVNGADACGRTLLHWAVESSHYEAIELLLKSGADQHVRDHKGRSPRHIAQSQAEGQALLELLNAYR